MRRRLPVAFFIACLLLLGSVPAFAQSEWIVLPYGSPQPGQAARASEHIVRALRQRRLSVVSLHETRDRYVARSRLPAETKPHEATLIQRGKERALEDAAFGRREAARRNAEEALAIAARSIETLDRDTQIARAVLDACLALVRIDLQVGDRRAALEEAKRCRRMVPDLAPKPSMHSAEVIGALAEAENQLLRSGAAPLTFEVEGENGCSVFVNGRRLGTAPFRLEGAAPGEVRVDVECGDQRSRVRVLTLGDNPVSLRINPAHDARVRDDEVLALSYASEGDERAHLVEDARAVAQLVGAKQVVLAREMGSEHVLLVRYDLVRARAVANAVITREVLDDHKATAWEHAAEVLALEQESVPMPAAFTAPAPAVGAAPSKQPPAETVRIDELDEREPDQQGPHEPRTETPVAEAAALPPGEPAALPQGLAPPGPLPPVPPAYPKRGVLIAGGVLSGLGAAVLATGYGLYGRSLTLKRRAEEVPLTDEYMDLQAQRQAEYDSFRNMPLVGLGGAALLATATPMLVPHRAPRSGFAWFEGALVGLAGAALIGYGAIQVGDESGEVLGTLLVSSGVALVEVPITQIVRAVRAP